MKLPYRILLLFLYSLYAGTSMAHGPTPKKADHSIEINAPVDQVWTQVQTFERVADWHPLVLESTGDQENKAGSSQRILTLKQGQLIEGLSRYDAAQYQLGYRLNQENVEAFPVSFYTAKIKIEATNDHTSTVRWKSRFYRGDTGNFPPEKLNDEAAIKAMDDFIKAGLQGLKDKVEASQP